MTITSRSLFSTVIFSALTGVVGVAPAEQPPPVVVVPQPKPTSKPTSTPAEDTEAIAISQVQEMAGRLAREKEVEGAATLAPPVVAPPPVRDFTPSDREKMSLLKANGSAAPTFVPPSEAMPPFRRDRLPINTDAMISLSQMMMLLSQGASMDEAPQRRAVAQALALALALDPANSYARDILSSIAESKRLGDPDPEKLDHAKTQIWKLNDWLSTPEAGNDGNLLADLLGDTAAALDPEHPSAEEWINFGERGKWDGWVDPLASFQEREKSSPPPIANIEANKPDATPDKKLFSELKSSSGSIGAVLYDNQPNTDSYVLGRVNVFMQATPLSDKKGDEIGIQKLNIKINCSESVSLEVFQKVSTPIIKALAKVHDVNESILPKVEIRIRTGKAESYSIRRNDDDMTGPGFILANAALTGIAPDAIFMSNLDSEGEKLELPDFFWKKLNALIDGDGGRLVVPAAAEEYLTALLAMEKPEFFMKFEVLLASSPEEAIRLCAMKPDAELATTLAKFKQIKDKSTSSALGPYLANVYVRKRLVEISQAAPYHLSAKLLAMQGAGAHPRALDKKILAVEIFDSVDPLNEFSEMNIWELNEKKIEAMGEAQDETRERLNRIEPYAHTRDRELFTSAEDLIAYLRSMIRITQDRRTLLEKGNEISRAHRAFQDANRKMRLNLALITGESLPKNN